MNDSHHTAGGRPRTVLEAEIRRREQTYEEVARAFSAVAADVGTDATLTARHLRRLASGERPTTGPLTRRVLAHLFGRPAGELLSAYEESTVSTGHSPRHRSEEELIAVAAQRARRFTIFSAAPMPEGAMEQVLDDVRGLCVAYQQAPISEILSDLVDTQDAIFSLLEQRHRPRDARQLYLLAGVVGGMLAKAAHDMANPQSAATQARAAFLAAEQAEHDGLRAWIRGLQSLVSYWSGRYAEAVRYAQEGQRYGAAGTISTWLPVSEARAWAALGNAEGARQGITTAERLWDAVGSDELDELGGLCRFSRSRHLYYAADALAWLPDDADAAATSAEVAVQSYSDRNAPEWAFGDEAGSQADLAIARVRQRDLDGAHEALAPVLSLPVDLRINGVVHSVQNVERALVGAGYASDPAATSLREAIEDFSRVSLAGSRH